MAWSPEVDDRDYAQERQWAWVESWSGWDQIPRYDQWGSETEPGSGWNALHGDMGGGFPDSTPWRSNVPSRFWSIDDLTFRADQ